MAADMRAKCAFFIRQLGTDPDGVERAMLAAGYPERYAHGMREQFGAFLAGAGYDVTPLVVEASVPEPVMTTTVEAPSAPEPEAPVDFHPEPVTATEVVVDDGTVTMSAPPVSRTVAPRQKTKGARR